MSKNKGPVYNKSFKFALNIIELYKKLIEQKEFVISKQLLRSGISIGANVVEASAGFSRKDFLYKMSIASKEARETNYWLLLLKESRLTNLNITDEISECDELIRLLTSIVKTTQHSIKQKN